MPRLPSSTVVIKTLERKGFIFISQKGSHAKYRKDDGEKRTAIVPMNKKEIPLGTFHSIVRQSGLRLGDFKEK